METQIKCLYCKANDCLVVRISNYEGQVQNIKDLSDFIVSNIKRAIIIEKPLEKMKQNLKEFISNFKFSVEIEKIALSLKKEDVIISGLLRDKLKEIWDNLKDNYTVIVILIDEAESIEKIEGSLMFLREVFSRLGEESVNYMLVLSGN